LGLTLPAEERRVWLRWTADVGAAAGHDSEARQGPEQAVVAQVGRAPRDLASIRISEKGGDDELTFRERRDRSQVDGAPPLAEERRQDGQTGRRQRDGKGDQAAEGERGSLEQSATRVALAGSVLGGLDGRSDRRVRRCVASTNPDESGRE